MVEPTMNGSRNTSRNAAGGENSPTKTTGTSQQASASMRKWTGLQRSGVAISVSVVLVCWILSLEEKNLDSIREQLTASTWSVLSTIGNNTKSPRPEIYTKPSKLATKVPSNLQEISLDPSSARSPALEEPTETLSQQAVLEQETMAQKLLHSVQSLRMQFHERYGEDAPHILKRGIRTFDCPSLSTDEKDTGCLRRTARRILQRIKIANEKNDHENNKKNFVMSFGGYSITIGRGNYFHQSYPFVLANILRPVWEEILGLQLVVRNHGIGGIPSFPYGWCLREFMGSDSDVVGWDYGMNEQPPKSGPILEAYLRNLQSIAPRRKPMFLQVDMSDGSRLDMIQRLLDNGLLQDAVAVGFDDTALGVEKPTEEHYPLFQSATNETDLPDGFRNWTEWGAPIGTPGQVEWHPTYKRHELIGWLLAMHFVNVLEVLANLLEQHNEEDKDDEKEVSNDSNLPENSPVWLPPPIATTFSVVGFNVSVHEEVRSMLHGTPHEAATEQDNNNNKKDTKDLPVMYTIAPISCRTSFGPLVDGAPHLRDIVVSGVKPPPPNHIVPFTSLVSMDYHNGSWVVDVGIGEMVARKKSLETKAGYIDSKIALYGISGSGPLTLWLPTNNTEETSRKTRKDSSLLVSSLVAAIVICEVNDTRGRNRPCVMTRDIAYKVGGVATQAWTVKSVGTYPMMGQVCLSLEIPPDAALTLVEDVTFDHQWTTTPTTPGSDDKTTTKDSQEHYKKGTLGVLVELEITRPTVSREDGPCSVSHVLWQQQPTASQTV